MACRNIRRAGGSIECEFGLYDKSWSLFGSSGVYRFYHKNIGNDVSGPKSSRVGVYLDHSEGLLCFYSISPNMELLHKVQTTFTQPLYAGLLIGLDSFAKFVVWESLSGLLNVDSSVFPCVSQIRRAVLQGGAISCLHSWWPLSLSWYLSPWKHSLMISVVDIMFSHPLQPNSSHRLIF